MSKMKLRFQIGFTALLFLFCSNFLRAQEYFAIYNAKGKPVKCSVLVESFNLKEIVLFGELHNDSSLHVLELEITKKLAEKNDVVLGAEMLERHDQAIIDEYVQGIIDTTTLFKEASLWPNFKTDYLPLVDLARSQKRTFVATNIPRSLAKVAAFKSVEHLDSIATDSIKDLVAPFPFELPEKAKPYKALIKSDFGASHGMDTKKIVAAQALKDATMAESILKNWEKGQLFIHYNGDFHSIHHGGIGHWLRAYSNEKLDIGVISAVESKTLDFDKEWKKQGDFIIVVLDSAPKSY